MKEPYSLAVDGSPRPRPRSATSCARRKPQTDPNQQITAILGSGPFTYNHDATRPGQRYVYDRNANYVPRSEPPAGMPAARS